MNMDNLVRNLRVLWRADSILADIQLRHILFRSGVNAFAALIAVFGLLMLELAAYLALVQLWNPIWAATSLGLGNFVIAMLLTFVASRRGHGRELELAKEVHKSAIEALQADAKRAEAELGTIMSAIRHPLDGALAGLIIPLAGTLLKTLRRSGDSQK